jgi:hypothetical protein
MNADLAVRLRRRYAQWRFVKSHLGLPLGLVRRTENRGVLAVLALAVILVAAGWPFMGSAGASLRRPTLPLHSIRLLPSSVTRTL